MTGQTERQRSALRDGRGEHDTFANNLFRQTFITPSHAPLLSDVPALAGCSVACEVPGSSESTQGR